MSIYTIVATGDSAKDWIPRGYTIGVNDAGKWGKPLHALLNCNRPSQFIGANGNKERFNTIINTKCETFYSHKSNWAEWFPNWQKINIVTWYGCFRPKQVYSSGTSPFIAISLAAKLGATEIILYGCDFVTHWLYSESNPQTAREIAVYMELIAALEENGIKVWLGAEGSALPLKLFYE